MIPHLTWHYVYVLKTSADDKLYVGRTTDLARRMQEHDDGKSEWTAARRPVELIYYEAYQSEEDAMLREKNLKWHGQAIRHLKGRIEKTLTNRAKLGAG